MFSDFISNFIEGMEDAPDISIYGSGQGISLPVLPESFELTVSNNNSTVNINNIGEYNCVGKTGLKHITLSSFFPLQHYPFAAVPRSPYDYVQDIEAMRSSGDYITLSISGTPISLPCLIDSFAYGERDGSGDVYYTLSLSEYKLLDSDTPVSKNGLKKRKTTFLQKVATNIQHGNDLRDSIAIAAGQTVGENDKQKFIFEKYKSAIRVGADIADGQAISYDRITDIFKVGGKIC